MNIHLYHPTRNNVVLRANRDLFRQGFGVCWNLRPLFIFPVNRVREIPESFVESASAPRNRHYLPNIQRNSGRLIEITNHNIPGAVIDGFYFHYWALSTLGWTFRVVPPTDQTPIFDGNVIARRVAEDIENYTFSLWTKNNGPVPHF